MDGNIEGKSLLIGQVSKLRDKEEQEKTIDITENGTTEVIPDGGKTLSKVTVNVAVPVMGGMTPPYYEGTVKPEQEKIVDITENGTTEVLPDENKVLSKVTVNVNVAGGTEEIESLIDESGVLEDTEGTVTEKVEELIDKANELDAFQSVTAITFDKTTFPSKERVRINLPNVSNLDAKFSSWNNEPIPKVDELILTAPKAKSIGMLFYYCSTFKKVVLTLSNDIANVRYAFGPSNSIEEITLYFSTENVTNFNNCFGNTPIKTIEGTLDFSSATDVANMFSGCGNLENVTFKPNTLSISISLANSSKLTSTSVDSIIEGLKTLDEGATAQTLTLHKNIVLTDTQKANIQAKRWTLVQ